MQNRGQHDFFTETIRLKTGEINISPLDLNIEQNRIEVQYKPTLQVSTPVMNRQGMKRSIAILNVYGQVMLESLAQTVRDVADPLPALNSDGYFLGGPRVADEWGFMFKRTDLSLAVGREESALAKRRENQAQSACFHSCRLCDPKPYPQQLIGVGFPR